MIISPLACDYLGLVANDPPSRVFDVLPVIFDDNWDEQGARNFIKEIGGRFGIFSKFRNVYGLLVLPGAIANDHLLPLSNLAGLKFSRLDFKVDVEGHIDLSGCVLGDGKDISFIHSDLQTLYLFSRSSARCWRIYQKVVDGKPVTRFEVELKDFISESLHNLDGLAVHSLFLGELEHLIKSQTFKKLSHVVQDAFHEILLKVAFDLEAAKPSKIKRLVDSKPAKKVDKDKLAASSLMADFVQLSQRGKLAFLELLITDQLVADFFYGDNNE